jgi:hypothetical protein
MSRRLPILNMRPGVISTTGPVLHYFWEAYDRFKSMRHMTTVACGRCCAVGWTQRLITKGDELVTDDFPLSTNH